MANDKRRAVVGIEMDEADNKVDDVFDGVKSFGSLIATIADGQLPSFIVMMMGAEWMSTMLHKLVVWGAITEAEQQLVLVKIAAEKERTKAAFLAAQEEHEQDEEPNEGKSKELEKFLSQFGI